MVSGIPYYATFVGNLFSLSNSGVIWRFFVTQASDREYLIRVSYMEIYNEEIKDLLCPDSRKLQIHENIEVISPTIVEAA